MIANERQYRITKTQLARFEKSIAAHDASEPSPGVDPLIHKAMRDAMESEIVELRAQIDRYEQLRDGHIREREIDSFKDLPVALVEARIAAQLTQRDLAKRIGVAEQQIQRWEANDYSGINLDRLQEIADALDMQIHEAIIYSSAATAFESST